MDDYVNGCVRRLRETSGILDFVKEAVNTIHHSLRVGKGDENLDLQRHLQPGRHRDAEDEQQNAEYHASQHEESSQDHAHTAKNHADLAQQHGDAARAARAKRNHAEADQHDSVAAQHRALANHNAKLAKHHEDASKALHQAADHFSRKRWHAGDSAAKIAKKAQNEINLMRTRGRRLKADKGPPLPRTGAAPKRPRSPATGKPRKPRAARQPSASPAPATTPSATPPAAPHPATTPKAGVVQAPPHAPSPPTPNRPQRAKKPGAGAGLRAASPGGNNGPDPNDTTGLQPRVANRDVVVTGKINGRNMTSTVHAGQTYHLRDVNGQTQLVMPGFFGRFMLDAGEQGKL